MKKLFFISALLLSTFLFQKQAEAQLLSLDSVIGIPETVIVSQSVSYMMFISKSGGVVFSGDLTIYIHTVNDSNPPDTIFHSDQYVLSANTFSDTIEGTYDFNATNLDAGDNIVVVWPASSMLPQEVEGDTMTFHIFLDNIGVDENKHRQSVTVFPNPSRTEIQFFYGFAEKVEQVRVLDILGKEIFSFDEAVKRFNVEALDEGIYFVEVKSRDGDIVVKKFFRY